MIAKLQNVLIEYIIIIVYARLYNTFQFLPPRIDLFHLLIIYTFISHLRPQYCSDADKQSMLKRLRGRLNLLTPTPLP